ncbi:hypothetical protein MKX01_040037 [Papaver californicum]|nr:hypothetical protein MKX01_040037 [Papaver californicum]
MARKGNRHKNGLDRPKETFVEDKQRVDTKADILQSASICNGPREVDGLVDRSDASDFVGENGTSVSGNQNLRTPLDSIRHGFHSANMRENSGSFYTILGRNLGELVVSILKVVNGWLERKKPLLNCMTTILLDTHDYVHLKILQAYPIICRCLRGFSLFLRLGTTSFFAVIWCSIFSVLAMIGIWKFLMIMGVAFCISTFCGLHTWNLAIAISATVSLWIRGGFWTIGLVIAVGGLGFLLKSESFVFSITTTYSFCRAWI